MKYHIHLYGYGYDYGCNNNYTTQYLYKRVKDKICLLKGHLNTNKESGQIVGPYSRIGSVYHNILYVCLPSGLSIGISLKTNFLLTATARRSLGRSRNCRRPLKT